MLFSLAFLLGNSSGNSPDTPQAPTFQEDPTTVALRNKLYGQTSDILGTSYQTLVNRFSPSKETSGLFSNIENQYSNLFNNQNYNFSPSAETQGLITDSLSKYKDLFNKQDYGIADFSNIQKNYLDTVLVQYNLSREKAYKPIQEGLIANNLYGSGPGFGIMSDYAKGTSQGVADIANTWAQENIQTQLQQQQYKDALLRGDYSTMYNLALSEQNRQFTTQQYADQLKRSDLGTLLGLTESQMNREIAPQVQATNTQFTGASSAGTLLNQMSAEDLAKYQAALQAYDYNNKARTANTKNLGGLGTALGIGAGLLLAPATGGTSLLFSGALGGAAGAGLGSMFQY